MNTLAIKNRLPWSHARAELRALRHRIADVFDAFYGSLPPDEQERLQVAIVRYPYADKIIDAGYPYWPNGTEVPPEFIVSNSLPFGFILDNCCEASDELYISGSLQEICQAILSPRDTVGLFELLDFLTEVPYPQKPEWNITAGATTIYVPPNLNTQQSKTLLERQLKEHVDFPGDNGSLPLISLLSALKTFEQIRQGWTVKVMYFSRGWVNSLRMRQDSYAAAAVKGLLVERGWKALARIRKQKSNRLREHLNTVCEGANQIGLVESAVSLLTNVDDILAGRRPCFVPVWEDDNLGPFGKISTRIIEVAARERTWILRPTYLSSESIASGYIRLDHASLGILKGRSAMGTKDKVRAIMRNLRAAAQRVKAMHNNGLAEAVEAYTSLLPHIMFQTPATKSNWERPPALADASVPATGQGSHYFKCSIKPGVKLVSFASRDFYAPHFKSIPRERCAFFRNSLLVSAAD